MPDITINLSLTLPAEELKKLLAELAQSEVKQDTLTYTPEEDRLAQKKTRSKKKTEKPEALEKEVQKTSGEEMTNSTFVALFLEKVRSNGAVKIGDVKAALKELGVESLTDVQPNDFKTLLALAES